MLYNKMRWTFKKNKILEIGIIYKNSNYAEYYNMYYLATIFSFCYKIFGCKGVWTSATNCAEMFLFFKLFNLQSLVSPPPPILNSWPMCITWIHMLFSERCISSISKLFPIWACTYAVPRDILCNHLYIGFCLSFQTYCRQLVYVLFMISLLIKSFC